MPIPSNHNLADSTCSNENNVMETETKISNHKQQSKTVTSLQDTCSDAMETDVAKEEDLPSKYKAHRKNQKRSLLLHARAEGEKIVDISETRLRPVSSNGLYAGSFFHGTQKCGIASYEVNVELLHVDLKESTLCGYLKIKGLTSEFPELTTFFEAEIIGSKYSFHTRKWQADQQSDLLHWKKFPSFAPYINTFNDDGFALDKTKADSDFVYMRWKELFLVPNHHVSAIHGASFAGFYYICYQRSTNRIKGFYFFRHHKDWFQELTLDHVPDHGMSAYEFR
ncbi:Glucose-induced degradation protein 4 [Choanephora cucurbitarum]|uniref:Glucose-induced degradation protein 4 n=1 Tax=Choanephora cucurbitarum TaxID=101091 RepID=A0A1C7NFZ0_9FUNG|nr:Glucose-induced degradation protein 4 [Choanephora cucurbitarum]